MDIPQIKDPQIMNLMNENKMERAKWQRNSSFCERVPEMRRITVDPNLNICQSDVPLVHVCSLLKLLNTLL